jgi:hypothetical protein
MFVTLLILTVWQTAFLLFKEILFVLKESLKNYNIFFGVQNIMEKKWNLKYKQVRHCLYKRSALLEWLDHYFDIMDLNPVLWCSKTNIN